MLRDLCSTSLPDYEAQAGMKAVRSKVLGIRAQGSRTSACRRDNPTSRRLAVASVAWCSGEGGRG